MNVSARFTEEIVSFAKSYCNDLGEAPATFRRRSFAEYSMISLQRLRIFLDKTREMIIRRLEAMPPILKLENIVMHVW